MKRHRLLMIAILALVALGLFYTFEPSHTPAGQPPLATLTSANFASSFYGAVNSSPRAIRVVLLVSPT